MEIHWVILSFLVALINHIHTVTISDTITGNTTFYYRQLSKYPYKKATLSVSVSQVPRSIYTLDFYMFNGEFKPERNCSYQKFGQLRNEDQRILLRRGRYRFYRCVDVGSKRSCHGKTTIQDFIPKHFGFSIGVACDHRYNNSTLGHFLTFNISLYDATNHTLCRDEGEGWKIPGCSAYYTHTTFPNLVGHQYSRDAHMYYNKLDSLYRFVDKDYPKFNCYQHFHEFLCHILSLRCDHQIDGSAQMVPPCREACLDFLEGCVAHLISFLPKIKLITGKNFTNISEIDRQQMMNCNYLPMVNGTSPCFYDPVSCPAPPSMQNGYLLM